MVERLVAALHSGTLTEDGLRAGAVELAGAGDGCQELLILETGTSSPAAQVMAFSHFAGGEAQVVPDDPAQWPYATPLAAVKDGWRIIAFPEMALLLSGDEDWRGLGFRFVLERWR